MAKLIHACLEVSDLDRAVAFYGTAFGLSLVDRHEGSDQDGPYRIVYLRGPESETELELIQWPARADLAPPAQREQHIAFVVDDLAAERRRLAALCEDIDAALTDHRPDGGLAGRYFFLRDPDGNAIEVMQRMGRYG